MWKKIIIKFYFYCTKIRALLRTSLMFLWELKNGIISTNLRELCVIETPKPNRKIPPTVASWTSFADLQSVLSHQIFYYTVPEPVEGTFSLLISVPEPVEGTFSLLISVPERSRRHIISIALKSVHSIEHLWCFFENSKTPSFHKIFVNFVLLK